MVTKAPHAILKRCICPFETTAVVHQAAVSQFAVDEDMLLDNVGRILQCFTIVNCDWHTLVPPPIGGRADL